MCPLIVHKDWTPNKIRYVKIYEKAKLTENSHFIFILIFKTPDL